MSTAESYDDIVSAENSAVVNPAQELASPYSNVFDLRVYRAMRGERMSESDQRYLLGRMNHGDQLATEAFCASIAPLMRHTGYKRASQKRTETIDEETQQAYTDALTEMRKNDGTSKAPPVARIMTNVNGRYIDRLRTQGAEHGVSRRGYTSMSRIIKASRTQHEIETKIEELHKQGRITVIEKSSLVGRRIVFMAHKSLEVLREDGRRYEVPNDKRHGLYSEPLEPQDTFEAAASLIEAEQLVSALHELGANQQTVIRHLYAVDGSDYKDAKELAEMLGVKVATIHSTASQALASLREKLEGKIE